MKADIVASRVIHGADGVQWSPEAEGQSPQLKPTRNDDYATMMVKHSSEPESWSPSVGRRRSRIARDTFWRQMLPWPCGRTLPHRLWIPAHDADTVRLCADGAVQRDGAFFVAGQSGAILALGRKAH